ncbi:hypothetical protein EGW08_012936 [Elysia chlorotica]|uniref:IRS-type PTB domain-containing protein n=1 Tax=Elysia chlorotica TaxID=188477 RepID=A0A433TCL6_ELYCH|nr:hypothetical protein EGW08_012936 [Elysia chlorotica]
MADGSLVVDGKIKFREGKKWKPRWCILKKPSPVADRLQVILYKDVTESRKAEAKPKSVFSLDGFFGLNSGFYYDRENHVMAILCQKSISLMAFECRDDMIQFEINIRQSLGEEHQFPVKVVKAPSACRLPKDQMLLMIHDCRICVVVLSPPKILMIWNVDNLRRFGAQNGKFCFEGGEKCGKGSGMFAFQSEQAEDIADIVHLASTGKTSNCHRKFKNRRRQPQDVIDDDKEAPPLTIVPVDIPFADMHEIEFGFGSSPSFSVPPVSSRLLSEVLKVDNVIKCVSPAKTVLRPRAGAEYAVIQRRPLSSAFFGFPDDAQDSCENRIFNFDMVSTARSPVSFNQGLGASQLEASPFYHVAPPNAPSTVYASLSHSLCSVEATPQRSPSISFTSKSLVSLPEESPSREDSSLYTKPANTYLLPPTPSPQGQAKVERTLHPVSPVQYKARTNEELFFFPIDEPVSAANSPSPRHRGSCKSASPHVPSPIYVNQEFIDKHHSNQSRNTSYTAPVSATSHFSASPLRAGMHSLMSLFFKDSSSKHNSHTEPLSVLYRRSSTRSGLSESEAIKIEKKPFKINHSRSLTLPHSRTNACLSLPGGLHSSHKEDGFKDRVRQERSTAASQSRGRLNGREYNNFAESSIISRRRLMQAQSEAGLASQHQKKSDVFSGHKHPPDRGKLPAPATKSSGYKNIDCFGAAIAISPSGTACAQPYSPSESHPNLHEQLNRVNDRQLIRHGSNELNKVTTPTALPSTPLLPPSPPPPLPLRRRRPSSPSPPPALERTSSEISTDSAPSYFAPSPPSSPALPDLPPLPPRRFPPGSRCAYTPSPRTPLEAHPGSPNSSEDLNQQELNYIMVDMTESAKPPVRPPSPPVASRRRSKRARQQRVEDSGKSSYALIDFTVTRALEKAGQEHRDDSLRRASGQLNRMNSVPSSAGRKPLSLVTRERKLSSGSIESC